MKSTIRPINFHFKYLLYRLSCRKLFESEHMKTIDYALEKTSDSTDLKHITSQID